VLYKDLEIYKSLYGAFLFAKNSKSSGEYYI